MTSEQIAKRNDSQPGASRNETRSEGDWFIVAGYFGQEISREVCDFAVVQAGDLDEALEQAQDRYAGFNAVSALREADLRKYLDMIDAARAGQ